jgi:hypothetical protein
MSTDVQEGHVASIFRVEEKENVRHYHEAGSKHSSGAYTALYPRK